MIFFTLKRAYFCLENVEYLMAWIRRISVPDLSKYVDYYNDKHVHELFKRWETSCEAIRSLTQNWGHVSVWHSKLLSR